jgi:hypothetical protein
VTYTARPGTVAQRAIAHLESLPRGAELMTSRLAEAIGTPGENLLACLEAPLKHGAVFRRQKDTAPRAPFFWSLVDHSKKPQQGANRDASAEQSHGAAGSDSPTGRGVDGASAVGAAPVSSSTPDTIDEPTTALRFKNASWWLTGQLAIEATDGTVILCPPVDAQRLAEFAQRMRGAS